MKKVKINIITEPVNVEYECPECKQHISISYNDFDSEDEDPCDWEGHKITCPSCNQELEILDWYIL